MRTLVFAAFTVALGVFAACATAPVDADPGPDNADGGSSGESGAGSSGEGGAGSSGEGGTPRDGAVSGDGASLPGARIPCGATFCRSDQKCEAGTCSFACSGTQVPGDYATLSAAVTALALTGLDATICYKPQLTNESVTITDPANHGKVLKIYGASADRSAVGSMAINPGFANVEVVGLNVQHGLTITGTKATLRALRVSITTTNAALWAQQQSGKVTDVTVDGCDITGLGTNGMAVRVDNTFSAPTSMTFVLTNSYLHGGAYGLYTAGSGNQLTLNVVNNTIDKETYGLHFGQGQGTVLYANNIISNHTNAAINIANAGAAASITHGHNALFGNANNYAGVASDGPGYVKADCNMDSATTVPQTKPGSPCRGVGDKAKAPAIDYWNAPRGAAVDLGAVQGP